MAAEKTNFFNNCMVHDIQSSYPLKETKVIVPTRTGCPSN